MGPPEFGHCIDEAIVKIRRPSQPRLWISRERYHTRLTRITPATPLHLLPKHISLSLFLSLKQTNKHTHKFYYDLSSFLLPPKHILILLSFLSFYLFLPSLVHSPIAPVILSYFFFRRFDGECRKEKGEGVRLQASIEKSPKFGFSFLLIELYCKRKGNNA